MLSNLSIYVDWCLAHFRIKKNYYSLIIIVSLNNIVLQQAV